MTPTNTTSDPPLTSTTIRQIGHSYWVQTEDELVQRFDALTDAQSFAASMDLNYVVARMSRASSVSPVERALRTTFRQRGGWYCALCGKEEF